jgi:hypothetical protein
MILTMPLFWMLKAFVLCKVWGWFIVPSFGVDMLSIRDAVGLSVAYMALVGAANVKKGPEGEEEKFEKRIFAISSGIITPLLILLFGFIAHLIF